MNGGASTTCYLSKGSIHMLFNKNVLAGYIKRIHVLLFAHGWLFDELLCLSLTITLSTSLPLNDVTNFTEQMRSQYFHSYSKNFLTFMEPKDSLKQPKSPPVAHILSQMNIVHNLTNHFFHIHCNIMPSFIPRSSNGSLQTYQIKFCTNFSLMNDIYNNSVNSPYFCKQCECVCIRT
jgi:hypothetical protein